MTYRRYCARRAARLIKVLGQQQPRKYNKERSGPAGIVGKGQAAHDERQLLVLIAHAERAWAYAMELKADPTAPRSVGRHAASRLRKAVKWASELARVAAAQAPRRAALECEAYSSWLSATQIMEQAASKEAWTAALEKLRRARAALGEAEPLGDAEAHARCRQFMVEIEPAMKYCEYKGGDASGPEPVLTLPGASLGNDAAAPAASTEAAGSGEPVTLCWRGQEHVVTSGAVHAAAARAQAASEKLAMDSSATDGGGEGGDGGDAKDSVEEGRMGVYDSLLMAYSDAQSAARSAGASDDVQACLKGLYLEASIARSEEMVRHSLSRWEASQAASSRGSEADKGVGKGKGGKNKQQGRVVRIGDVLHLLETVAATTKELGGVSPDDQVLAAECVASEAVTHARRCTYLAGAHAREQRLAEAESLLSLAGESLSRAQQLFERLDGAGDGAGAGAVSGYAARVRSELADVDARSRSLRCVVRARSATAGLSATRDAERGMAGVGLGASAGASAARPALHLSTAACEFVSYLAPKTTDGGLAEVPPAFEAVPARPIMFDIAASAIDYPDMSEFKPKEDKAGSYMGGFAKSLFGWGSK